MQLIAELCQNHNGDLKILKDLAISAKRGGAHFAKIQALYSSELVFREEFENENVSKFGMYRPYNKELDRLRKLDLDEKQEAYFVEYCKKIGIEPMITVFTINGAARAKKAGFEHIKIASYNSTDLDLVYLISDFAKSITISTGATTSFELERTVNFLKSNLSNIDVTLLHCRTIYPNELDSINLKRMQWMQKFGYKVGFSDHTRTFYDNYESYEHKNIPAFLAIHLGATVIERHFTNLHPSKTKDGLISINQSDLEMLIEFESMTKIDQDNYLASYSNEKIIILGDDDFEPTVEEWWNRRYYKGRVITKNKRDTD